MKELEKVLKCKNVLLVTKPKIAVLAVIAYGCEILIMDWRGAL